MVSLHLGRLLRSTLILHLDGKGENGSLHLGLLSSTLILHLGGKGENGSLHLGLLSSNLIHHLEGKGENGFFAPWVVELYFYTSPGWEG